MGGCSAMTETWRTIQSKFSGRSSPTSMLWQSLQILVCFGSVIFSCLKTGPSSLVFWKSISWGMWDPFVYCVMKISSCWQAIKANNRVEGSGVTTSMCVNLPHFLYKSFSKGAPLGEEKRASFLSIAFEGSDAWSYKGRLLRDSSSMCLQFWRVFICFLFILRNS